MAKSWKFSEAFLFLSVSECFFNLPIFSLYMSLKKNKTKKNNQGNKFSEGPCTMVLSN